VFFYSFFLLYCSLGYRHHHSFPTRRSSDLKLRPATVIKDDAIPALLRTVRQPTFVTINWPDFWHQTVAHPGFCLLCFRLPTDRRSEEHTSELQSLRHLVCRLLLEKKNRPLQ